MATRIITGIILAVIAILAVFCLPLWAFAVFISVLMILAVIEWLALARCRHWWLKLLYLIAVALVTVLGMQQPAILATVASLWWLFAVLVLLTPMRQSRLWGRRMVLLPLGVLIFAAAWVSAVTLHDMSRALLFYLMLLVALADTGAYFTGRWCGRHLLAPAISPKKTIEGLVGGGILATAVSVWVVPYFPVRYQLSDWKWVLITIGLVLLSVCGDLFESLIKRRVNIKDSGALLPGHGGILDRLDSLILVLPILLVILFLF